jgi:hypothetical protein
MPLKQWENRLFSRFRGFFNVWKLVGICAFFVKLWQQRTTIYLFDLFSEVFEIEMSVYLIVDILPKRVAHHGPLSERCDAKPVAQSLERVAAIVGRVVLAQMLRAKLMEAFAFRLH